MPIVEWKQYQTTPIPEPVHEQWKEDAKFVSGMALIMGKVWHRSDLLYPPHFLAGIDADNQLAINELFTMNWRARTLF
jgi:hypothetical protein